MILKEPLMLLLDAVAAVVLAPAPAAVVEPPALVFAVAAPVRGEVRLHLAALPLRLHPVGRAGPPAVALVAVTSCIGPLPVHVLALERVPAREAELRAPLRDQVQVVVRRPLQVLEHLVG